MKKFENLKISQLFSKTWVQFITFSGILWLIFVLLEVNRHLKSMIIGFHYWRKSDTYAQISNYYYNGLQFFDHSIYYNQLESGGKAVAEFPLYYYFIAAQQTIFGNHSMIAKVNWMVLLLFGLFSLFKIVNHFFNHFLLSIAITFSVFLCPIFSIYMIDYLPDPVAFNFLLIGLWFLLKFTKTTKKSSLIASLVFISMAGMIKPFFLIPYIALLMSLFINRRWNKPFELRVKWFYFIPFLLVISWFLYTNWYNSSVGSDYFLSQARPIWNATSTEIERTIYLISTYWFSDYIHPFLLWPFVAILIFNLTRWSKKTGFVTTFYLLSILGCIIFVLLFFEMMGQHDYYIFPLIFIIPLTFGVFFYHLTHLISWKFTKHFLGLISLLLLFFALSYTWKKTQARRMVPKTNSTYLFENYSNLEHFLNTNGATKDKLVVAFSDKSPSFALSLMNRKGWSGYQTFTFDTPLEKFIEQGAEFLIINKRAPKMKDWCLVEEYLDSPIADTNDVFLYKLESKSK